MVYYIYPNDDGTYQVINCRTFKVLTASTTRIKALAQARLMNWLESLKSFL
jgi:hypothetical protein